MKTFKSQSCSNWRLVWGLFKNEIKTLQIFFSEAIGIMFYGFCCCFMFSKDWGNSSVDKVLPMQGLELKSPEPTWKKSRPVGQPVTSAPRAQRTPEQLAARITTIGKLWDRQRDPPLRIRWGAIQEDSQCQFCMHKNPNLMTLWRKQPALHHLKHIAQQLPRN